MFHHILVPLDGSKRSEQALPVAARIARATGGSLLLVRVVRPYREPARTADEVTPFFFPVRAAQLSPSVSYEDPFQESSSFAHGFSYEDEEEGRYYLKMLAQSPLTACIEVETEVIVGKAAEEILTAAQKKQNDLIVMCSHGQTGIKRWMVGSVAQKVARHSPVPVLILREGAQIETGTQRIMVALDGSALSESALLPAAYLSAALSAPGKGALHLVRILPIPTVFEQGQSERLVRARTEGADQARVYLKHLEQRLHEGELVPFNLTTTELVDYDQDVAQRLISIAENDPGYGQKVGCDLLALATHGRSGLARFVMGSVVERVLGATQLPLLIVRPYKQE